MFTFRAGALFIFGALGCLGAPDSAMAAVGRSAGTFAVSGSGAATYSIPIWVPPGPRGLQPGVALTYGSNNDNSTVGVGWQLSGLSAISLCSRTVAQDGATSIQIPDRYCLGGQRLRVTTGAYGAANSTYQTEVADFSQATQFSNGQSQYFSVQTKSGLTYEYGNTADSRIILSGTAAQWLLDKVSDRNGTSYAITYGAGQAGTTGTAVPISISWGPTAPGGSTFNYSMQFTYALRPFADQIIGNSLGASVVNSNRLSAITVKSGAIVVRYYSLAYDSSPATSRSRLLSVTECADVAMTNCLSPTTATYVVSATGLAAGMNSAANSSSSFGGIADLNGDGRDDIYYVLNGTIYVAFGSSTGVSAPVNTGITAGANVFAGDLAGTGKSDLLTQVGGVWYRYYYSGGAFVGASTGLAVSPTNTAIAYGLADVNGDGLADLVSSHLNGSMDTRYVYINLNTTSNHVTSFGALTTVTSMPGRNCGTGAYTCIAYLNGLADVDGNGAVDIGFTRYAVGSSPPTLTWYSWNGSSFSALNSVTLSTPTVLPALKWNDDKCADFVSTVIEISACNGAVASTFAFTGTYVGAMDWDGDGRNDVLVRTSANTLGVQLSTGSGGGTLVDTGISLPTTTNVFPADLNGDGQKDLVFVSTVSPFAVGYMMHNAAASGLPDMLATITDGYGLATSVSYATLADPSVYTLGTGAQSPEVDTADPLDVGDETGRKFMVVKTATLPDGIGGSYTQTYQYTGARRNIQGRGFEGFQSVRTADSRATAPVTVVKRFTDFPYSGMASEADAYQNDGTTLISSTVISRAVTNLDTTANNQRYFPYISGATTTTYEVGGTRNAQVITTRTLSNVSYDNYGNLTGSTETLSDSDSTSPFFNQQLTTIVANTFSPDTTHWCVGLPTQTQVIKSGTSPSLAAITRTVSNAPDYVNCRVTQIITEPSSASYKVTEALGYDGFGNISSSQITGVGITARTTTVDWGTTGQFPVTIRDPLSTSLGASGYKIVRGYDYDHGLQTSEVTQSLDGTVNNAPAIQWQYDSFSRRTRETRPDGTATTWGFADCVAAGNCQTE